MAFSQYPNFIEEECKEWPVQKCSVTSELVKKFTPETKCHKEPKELCAPSGCGFVQGPEECYDKKETIIHDVSEMTLSTVCSSSIRYRISLNNVPFFEKA